MADTSGKWERLFNEIGEIKTALAVVMKRQDTCEGQIEKNTRTLRGNNGDPGLVAEVGQLQETISGIKKLGWIIVTALVGGIVAMTFTFVEVARALK